MLARGLSFATGDECIAGCRGLRTVDAASIRTDVAPFGIAVSKQVLQFFTVACEPCFGGAAAPCNQSRGNAVRFVVGTTIEVLISDRIAHATYARLSRSRLASTERRASTHAYRESKHTGHENAHDVLRKRYGAEPVAVSVRPRDSSNGPMSGSLP